MVHVQHQRVRVLPAGMTALVVQVLATSCSSLLVLTGKEQPGLELMTVQI